MNTKPLTFDLELLLDTLDPSLGAHERGQFLAIAATFDRTREHLRGEPDSPNKALAASENARVAAEAARAVVDAYLASRGGKLEELRRELLAPPEVTSENALARRFTWERLASADIEALDIQSAWHTFDTTTKDAVLSAPQVLRKGEDGVLRSVKLVSDELRENEMRLRKPETAQFIDAIEAANQRVEIVANAIVEGVKQRS